MNLVVNYVDDEKNTRWGYLTQDSVKLFNDYITKLKQQKEEGEGNNEVLDANILQISRMSIGVYLPDGTTGNARLEHITITPPFVQYSFRTPEESEESDKEPQKD